MTYFKSIRTETILNDSGEIARLKRRTVLRRQRIDIKLFRTVSKQIKIRQIKLDFT